MVGSNGLLIVAGLGLIGGAAYLLTRKEDASAEVAPPAPAPKALGLLIPTIISAPAQIALDTGLTAPEASAVLYALSYESHPENLISFASTLDPSYPLAAARLRERAASLGTRVAGLGEPCCASCRDHSAPCDSLKTPGASPVTMGLPKAFARPSRGHV